MEFKNLNTADGQSPSTSSTDPVFSQQMVYHPIINGLQKIALYETRTKYYLFGSNASQTKFRLLKIDRTEPEKLNLVDDGVLYDPRGVRAMLSQLQAGNQENSEVPGARLTRTMSAFGILGFVRFLQGYYLILVTKRRKIASVGLHTIYKVEETSIRYIPHEAYKGNYHKTVQDEENRYVRLFNNIDLKANFYFSYSYDLTHTLQHNLAPPSHEVTMISHEDLEKFLPDGRFKYPIPPSKKNIQYVTYLPKPDHRYVWNSYLLDPCQDLHPSWKLYVTHGFIEQVNINVLGHSFYLALMARRSRLFAGTRFLKRGTNCNGDVANEVETEQIVYDSATTDFLEGRFTSFVQVRGSIPAYWCQDVTKMVPKPPISFYLGDPMCKSAGKHFNRLLKRHGSPILCLDLTKNRDTRMHESTLGPHFEQQIKQLNLTLPQQFWLDYRKLDMAYLNKLPHDNAMNHLSKFSDWALRKTGVFCSAAVTGRGSVLHQTGTVRVNCVDCLDRTNTAQYALAKCALAHQLYALGVLTNPYIPWDTDCTRVLEELYEDHGDTMALQYGGSHLVHRIQTYRHTAKWSSHGSDMMQSLSRYYSNAFSDVEKQQSINLFLGMYVPSTERVAIWDMATDYHLHNPIVRGIRPCYRTSCSQWWDPALIHSLPLPLDLRRKQTIFIAPVKGINSMLCLDLYNDFHRPAEMTNMSDHFLQNVPSTATVKANGNIANPSPFHSRIKLADQLRQRNEYLSSDTMSLDSRISGLVSVTSEDSSVRNSKNSNKHRGSLAPSNSSSDSESTVSEEPGIRPPLELNHFEMGSSLSVKEIAACVRTRPLGGLKVTFNRKIPDGHKPGWTSLLREYDANQQTLFDEARQMHFTRQFGKYDPSTGATKGDTVSNEEEEDTVYNSLNNIVNDLFPDPSIFYGNFHIPPSHEELMVYVRHTLMAHPIDPPESNRITSLNASQLYLQSPQQERSVGASPTSGLYSPNSPHSPVRPPPSTAPPIEAVAECDLPSWVLCGLPPEKKSSEPLLLLGESTFKNNSSYETDEPTVDSSSRALYQHYVDMVSKGASEPSVRDIELYRRCVAHKTYNPRKDPTLLLCSS